ncbi:MAG: PAS domain S-box protein, partial [Chloroflexales bacterium]|nr:PAS domain S-box protein [Chloroflexales bacterium]
FALANCAEAALGATLLVRRVAPPRSLRRLRELAELAGWAAVGSTAIGALLGAAVAQRSLGAPFWSTWLTWWVSDGFGVLLVASVILAWASPSPIRHLPRQALEFALLCMCTVIATTLAFDRVPSTFLYPYQVFPFLIWAAVRFGPRQTTVLALLLTSVVLWSTIQGQGPFAMAGTALVWQLASAQAFLAVAILSALMLAAVMAERQQAKEDLQRAYANLERHVAERTGELQATNQQLQREVAERQRAEAFLTAVLQQLPSGVWIAEAPSGQLLLHNEEAERLLGHPLHAIMDIEGAPYGALHADGRPYKPGEYPIARALWAHEVVHHQEQHYRRGDGTLTIFSVNAAPIRDAGGRVVAAVSTFDNIASVKQMEQTLANSQAQLASIIDSAMDAIITVDDDQRITIWNAAAERMFSCPVAEALGQPLDRFIPARYQAKHREHVRAFGRTGTTTRTMGGLRPLTALRADGVEFPIEASISQVAIEGRKLYTVIMRDITARVRVEIELRISEERFSKAFQASPVAMVISAVSDGRILDANDRFLSLFGRDRGAVLGQTSIMLDLWVNPGDRARALELLRQHGAVRDLEVAIRAADDAEREVLLSLDQLQLADEPCLITTLYDISERKQAEQALRESRQQLQAILDNAPALISLKHPDGHYVLVNRRFEVLLAREVGQIIGHTDDDLFPQEQATLFQEHDRAVLEQGAPLEVEEMVPHADGPHTYSAVKFPLTDLTGASYALCSIATDVTERKQLEAQLLQSQKMESVGQLAGGIAHDFNNLLTAIGGYTELALADIPADNPATGDLHEVLKAADRAAALTRQLLAFARRQPIDPVIINLNTLVSELDKLLRRLISEAITLTIQLTPNLHLVKADPGQLEQVLINLVVNARDAMPEGGQLLVETANVVLDPRYAYGHLDIPAGPYVMLAVSDSGIGMTPEVQTHVFEPFFTTKEPGKGSGLGLSTCYGIVKQHGGTIWVYSEPGQGTSVKVYLPPLTDAHGEAPRAERDRQLPQGNETILVVEDEEAVRVLTARILRSCGYSVLEAAHGVEALRIARTYQPAMIHLLLTDMVMPQMGGRATADQVTAVYPGIKVLFMSGYTEHASLRQSRIVDGERFIQKPFTSAILAQAVRAMLDSSR